MSIYYTYIVNADDPVALEDLLSSLSSEFPIDLIEKPFKQAACRQESSVRKALGSLFGIGNKPEEIKIDKESYCRALGENETVIPFHNKVVIDLHAFGHKPTIKTDKDWYKISTSIDHRHGDGADKEIFAAKLHSVCQRVCWMPDTDSDQYSETYWDV